MKVTLPLPPDSYTITHLLPGKIFFAGLTEKQFQAKRGFLQVGQARRESSDSAQSEQQSRL